MTSTTGVVIASAGDVLLKVGADGEERKLLVSSEVLRSCSFYFKALTGDKFREVQVARSAQSPQIIVLQEDDAQAMEDLCLLLHGQEPTGFRNAMTKDASADAVVASVNRILSLAVAIDKYDCVGRLRLQCSGLLFEWLEACGQKPEPERWLAQLVTASYLLDNKHVFRITAERITKETLKLPNDKDWPTAVPRKMMPERVTDAIAAKGDRSAVIFATRLRSSLYESCPLECSDCRSQVDCAYEWQSMHTDEPWQLSIKGSMEQMQEIADDMCSSHEGDDRLEMQEALEDLGEIRSDIDRATSGLCLKCVRGGDSLQGKCEKDDH
ncbi:uncharacterized protein CLAFUR5_10010 [Fulvia fulva]|uniref:BTB domain-containing protein n=1 Tax=Passalora fulva TaxID=5499 RepID=A0A9Q8PDA8_PASFU|nr:uncharacterized protein CLAFUR5_10010 [Fulvia fulva]UJO20312.1 hypothetical protein CLAFUR5_10010 [Fulvia fulva]